MLPVPASRSGSVGGELVSRKVMRGASANGEWRDISKSPIGADFKASKAGRLALKYDNGTYTTVPRDSIPAEENQLVPVFRNGKLLKKWDFTELIERSERKYPEWYYADLVAELRAGNQPKLASVGR